MNDKVKEIYLSNARIKDSKHLLIIYEDGSMLMKWCYRNTVETVPNLAVTENNGKKVLTYGSPNMFGIKEKKPFKNEKGEMEEIWTKMI